MDKPQCPICGNKIEDEDYDCLDNGSPAHYKCAEKERMNESQIDALPIERKG